MGRGAEATAAAAGLNGRDLRRGPAAGHQPPELAGVPSWAAAPAGCGDPYPVRCLFLHPGLEWVELSPAVVEQATQLRAEHNLRTPDALQAASCMQLGAGAVMVTGDAGFQRVPSLRLALVNGGEGQKGTSKNRKTA